MTIERLDLGIQLPRLSHQDMLGRLERGGIGGVVEGLVVQWNRAMQEIEVRFNEQLGERINYLLDFVNTDYAYFGTQDINGNWDSGTYRIRYDTETGKLEIERYLSGDWVDCGSFYRKS